MRHNFTQQGSWWVPIEFENAHVPTEDLVEDPTKNINLVD